MLNMDLYAGGRALAMVRSGEHGADQCRVVPARPTNRIILPFPLDNCFLSVGLLYKSPSRRTRQTWFRIRVPDEFTLKKASAFEAWTSVTGYSHAYYLWDFRGSLCVMSPVQRESRWIELSRGGLSGKRDSSSNALFDANLSSTDL